MTSINLPSKRLNLEIIFWDVTILLINLMRSIVRAIPTSLPVSKRALIKLLTWMGWVLAGLSLGWGVGLASL